MQHGQFWAIAASSLYILAGEGSYRCWPVKLSQIDLLVRVEVSVQGSTGGEEWAVARDGPTKL